MQRPSLTVGIEEEFQVIDPESRELRSHVARIFSQTQGPLSGKLKPEHERAYFQRPRPVLELYDLDADPGELNNVAGRAEYRDIQETLTAAMQEKMITDYDFIPPVMSEARPRPAAGQRRQ